jgi:dTDP-4-amino-4,6-dideoxygalactose transaminase
VKIPAVLGGPPAFAEGLPFARPPCPPLERVMARLEPSYARGILTNGPLVAALEEQAAQYLGVRHVVAVASCTAGLMLTVKAVAEAGPVVVPSFTFSASAHAVAWNGRHVRFADCDGESFQVDIDHVETLGAGAGLIIGTHVFGAPCDVDGLTALGRAVGAPVVFDAAHGFGATREGRRIGTFGDAEVFSLSPTKLVVAGEGGLVATNRDDVADFVRLGRDYGNPGDYDTRFAGLNARMSELHAAMALESLDELDDHLRRRRAIAERYRGGLDEVPGLRTQSVPADDESTYKDFTIAVDQDRFGLTRDELRVALLAEGVDTRAYFTPPVHHQQAYRHGPVPSLPVTELVSSRVVSLPVYRDLPISAVDEVVGLITALNTHAGPVAAALRQARRPTQAPAQLAHAR